jgi:hypothetical protein
MNDHHFAPHSNETSQAERRELIRLRAIEAAAQAVSLAAWTDRHSRLHGHPAVTALDAALKPNPD